MSSSRSAILSKKWPYISASSARKASKTASRDSETRRVPVICINRIATETIALCLWVQPLVRPSMATKPRKALQTVHSLVASCPSRTLRLWTTRPYSCLNRRSRIKTMSACSIRRQKSSNSNTAGRIVQWSISRSTEASMAQFFPAKSRWTYKARINTHI